jgi:hypothetical protein
MNLGFRIPTGVESEPAERGVDLRKYLHFIWRHWIFILSVAALTFLVGVTYLASATPLYTATTQVLLEQRERAPAGDTLLNEGRIDTSGMSTTSLQSYAPIHFCAGSPLRSGSSLSVPKNLQPQARLQTRQRRAKERQ